MNRFTAFSLSLLLSLLNLTVPQPGSSLYLLQTHESWRSVRTNNLLVIGDVDPDNLRDVAAWLEFFHAMFSRLIGRTAIDSSVPTTVIVFRNNESFEPFKPLYQGKPANVAGYFQPGDDVNYIALTLDSSGRDPYSTAFHEYVHLHLRNNVSQAPLWLNEGLAEFFGATQFSGNQALLGAPIADYVRLLRSEGMLPLDTLFSVDQSSPHYNERSKAGIFYGESWALVHYLMLGDGGRHQDQFKRFLQLVGRGDDVEKSLTDTLGMTLPEIERALLRYIQAGDLSAQRVSIGDSAQGFTTYTATQRSSLSSGEANYYLGDLLVHIYRDKEAEPYFEAAITLEPAFIPPYASMGLMRVRQRRYAEAKKYLQKAATPSQNYLIHYLYAFVLGREGLEADGTFKGFPSENVATIRRNLQEAIKLNSQFAPAYHLLALVDFATNQELDEAFAAAEKSHQLQPGKAEYSLLLAHIHVRRSESDAARQLLEPLANAGDAAVRSEAQAVLDVLDKNRGIASARTVRESSPQPRLGVVMTAEPLQANSSRVINGGGILSTGVVRDGTTIDSSGSLPTVEELLKHYVQALGGESAIKGVTSRLTKGSLDVIGVSRNGTFEVDETAPNKSFTMMQAYSMGTIKIGFNGQNGWAQSSTVVRQLKGAELAAVQRDSDFYRPLRLQSNYSKITVLGKSKLGYREVYVLELQPVTGAAEKMLLDAETYLPVRINAFRTNGKLIAPVEIYLDDWRLVDGIKFPFSLTESFPGLTFVFRTTEIKHDVKFATAMFDGPLR